MNSCLIFIIIIAPILDSIPIERRARFKPRASGDGRQEEVLFQHNLTKPPFHRRESRDTKKGAGWTTTAASRQQMEGPPGNWSGYDPFKESRANTTNDTSGSKDPDELLEDEVPRGDESFPPVDTKYTGYIVVPAITVGVFVLLLLALAIILRPSGCFCNNFLKKAGWVPYSKRKIEEKKAIKEKKAETAIDGPKRKRGPMKKGRTTGRRGLWWPAKQRGKKVKKKPELLKEKKKQEEEALAQPKEVMAGKKTPGNRKIKQEPKRTPRQPSELKPAFTPHGPPSPRPPLVSQKFSQPGEPLATSSLHSMEKEALAQREEVMAGKKTPGNRKIKQEPKRTPRQPSELKPPLTPHAPPSPKVPFTSKKPVRPREPLATTSQTSMEKEALAQTKEVKAGKKTPGNRKIKQEPKPTPRQPVLLMPPTTTPHVPPTPMPRVASKKSVLLWEPSVASETSLGRSSERKLRFSTSGGDESSEEPDTSKTTSLNK